MRWRIAVAALLVLAGCSDDGGGSAPLDDRLAGAGSPLGDGFAVPEATRLVGPAPPRGGTWVVDLVLDGDPRDAVDDVVQRALAAGFDVEAHCGTSPARTRCIVRGLRIEGEWVREDVYLQLERSSGGAAYRSGGSLGHHSWPAGANDVGRGVEGLADDVGPLPRPELPPADDRPDLPGVGDPIASDGELIGGELDVVEGSEVVVPNRPSGCATGGFLAHLIITGDVDEVVEGYATQIEDFGIGRTNRSASDGHIRVSAGGEGGGDLTLEVELDGTAPVWATVTRCND